MSQRRRWTLTVAGVAPALVLAVLRLYGWFGMGDGGTVRFAGFGDAPMGTYGSALVTDGGSPGPVWSDAALVLFVALFVVGAAVYFGVASLDARRGAIGAFILGWGAAALAAAAGELALRELGSTTEFGWFATAPLSGDLLAGGSALVTGYGVLLGWTVGLVIAVTFVRTRPFPQLPNNQTK